MFKISQRPKRPEARFFGLFGKNWVLSLKEINAFHLLDSINSVCGYTQSDYGLEKSDGDGKPLSIDKIFTCSVRNAPPAMGANCRDRSPHIGQSIGDAINIISEEFRKVDDYDNGVVKLFLSDYILKLVAVLACKEGLGMLEELRKIEKYTVTLGTTIREPKNSGVMSSVFMNSFNRIIDSEVGMGVGMSGRLKTIKDELEFKIKAQSLPGKLTSVRNSLYADISSFIAIIFQLCQKKPNSMNRVADTFSVHDVLLSSPRAGNIKYVEFFRTRLSIIIYRAFPFKTKDDAAFFRGYYFSEYFCDNGNKRYDKNRCLGDGEESEKSKVANKFYELLEANLFHNSSGVVKTDSSWLQFLVGSGSSPSPLPTKIANHCGRKVAANFMKICALMEVIVYRYHTIECLRRVIVGSGEEIFLIEPGLAQFISVMLGGVPTLIGAVEEEITNVFAAIASPGKGGKIIGKLSVNYRKAKDLISKFRLEKKGTSSRIEEVNRTLGDLRGIKRRLIANNENMRIILEKEPGVVERANMVLPSGNKIVYDTHVYKSDSFLVKGVDIERGRSIVEEKYSTNENTRTIAPSSSTIEEVVVVDLAECTGENYRENEGYTCASNVDDHHEIDYKDSLLSPKASKTGGNHLKGTVARLIECVRRGKDLSKDSTVKWYSRIFFFFFPGSLVRHVFEYLLCEKLNATPSYVESLVRELEVYLWFWNMGTKDYMNNRLGSSKNNRIAYAGTAGTVPLTKIAELDARVKSKEFQEEAAVSQLESKANGSHTDGSRKCNFGELAVQRTLSLRGAGWDQWQSIADGTHTDESRTYNFGELAAQENRGVRESLLTIKEEQHPVSLDTLTNRPMVLDARAGMDNFQTTIGASRALAAPQQEKCIIPPAAFCDSHVDSFERKSENVTIKSVSVAKEESDKEVGFFLTRNGGSRRQTRSDVIYERGSSEEVASLSELQTAQNTRSSPFFSRKLLSVSDKVGRGVDLDNKSEYITIREVDGSSVSVAAEDEKAGLLFRPSDRGSRGQTRSDVIYERGSSEEVDLLSEQTARNTMTRPFDGTYYKNFSGSNCNTVRKLFSYIDSVLKWRVNLGMVEFGLEDKVYGIISGLLSDDFADIRTRKEDLRNGLYNNVVLGHICRMVHGEFYDSKIIEKFFSNVVMSLRGTIGAVCTDSIIGLWNITSTEDRKAIVLNKRIIYSVFFADKFCEEDLLELLGIIAHNASMRDIGGVKKLLSTAIMNDFTTEQKVAMLIQLIRHDVEFFHGDVIKIMDDSACSNEQKLSLKIAILGVNVNDKRLYNMYIKPLVKQDINCIKKKLLGFYKLSDNTTTYSDSEELSLAMRFLVFIKNNLDVSSHEERSFVLREVIRLESENSDLVMKAMHMILVNLDIILSLGKGDLVGLQVIADYFTTNEARKIVFKYYGILLDLEHHSEGSYCIDGKESLLPTLYKEIVAEIMKGMLYSSNYKTYKEACKGKGMKYVMGLFKTLTKEEIASFSDEETEGYYRSLLLHRLSGISYYLDYIFEKEVEEADKSKIKEFFNMDISSRNMGNVSSNDWSNTATSSFDELFLSSMSSSYADFEKCKGMAVANVCPTVKSLRVLSGAAAVTSQVFLSMSNTADSTARAADDAANHVANKMVDQVSDPIQWRFHL